MIIMHMQKQRNKNTLKILLILVILAIIANIWNHSREKKEAMFETEKTSKMVETETDTPIDWMYADEQWKYII